MNCFRQCGFFVGIANRSFVAADFFEFHELTVDADVEVDGACIDEELQCFSTEEHRGTDLLNDVAEQHDIPEVHESI